MGTGRLGLQGRWVGGSGPAVKAEGEEDKERRGSKQVEMVLLRSSALTRARVTT